MSRQFLIGTEPGHPDVQVDADDELDALEQAVELAGEELGESASVLPLEEHPVGLGAEPEESD
jgi:hypothetical protein